METIDSHIHIFNLKYLPVAGILRRFTSKANLEKPIIANAIARFLLNKTKSNFEHDGAEAFMVSESPIETISKKLKLVDFEKSLPQIAIENPEQLFSIGREDLSNRYCAMLNETDLQDPEIAEALDHFTKNIEGKVEGFSFTSGQEAFEIPNLELSLDTFTRMFKWFFGQMDEIAGVPVMVEQYLRWFCFMMNSENDIIDKIMNFDSKSDKKLDLDGDGVIDSEIKQFLFLMMDVDYFFSHPGDHQFTSYFDFPKQQIPNMAELIRHYEGKLIGFVAFNPMRPDCMDIVKGAVENQGFKGIKIYPPMGYKPNYDVPKNDFEKTVKEKTTLLYKYCVENDIPLFTHANNKGFQAYGEHALQNALGTDIMPSGYCANAKYWLQVLREHPTLRLNLGHAGGTQGWFAQIQATDHLEANLIDYTHIQDDNVLQEGDWNKSHAAMVYKLCEEFENVYCDFSFLDEMVKTDGSLKEEESKIFKNRLISLFQHSKNFSKKIMYGSDWHMIFNEGLNAVYYKAYQTFFSDPLLQPYAKDFFENNAKRYLKQISIDPAATIIAGK
ncbi:amidohydrolase family protein [Runella sp.]|uniref:amidohydrolase family protein n=1 Tax=Runella sp. TaxID=1960881 RepID=UPI003015A9C2